MYSCLYRYIFYMKIMFHFNKTMKKQSMCFLYQEKFADTPAFQYIANQFREYQVTSQKLCKGQNEMMMVGQTYLCMLESLRKSEVREPKSFSYYYNICSFNIFSKKRKLHIFLPTNIYLCAQFSGIESDVQNN